MGQLSIIAPTRNPSPLFLEEMARIALAEPEWQLVIVDDHSDVAVSDYLPTCSNLQVHRQECRRGAGACRNLGIDQIHNTYTLFLDDDDSVHWPVVRSGIEAMQAEPQIDVSFFLYDRLIDGEPADALERDRIILAQALQGQGQRKLNLTDHESLLAFTNYPWNKIYRTSFLRQAGIHFAETAVQNDILAHWLTLLQATVIALDERVLCTKVDYSDGERIGNIRDERTLEVCDALEQVYGLVRPLQRPAVKEVFLAYSQDLLSWRLNLVEGRLRGAMERQQRALIARMGADGFLDAQALARLTSVLDSPASASPAATAPADADAAAATPSGALLQAEFSRLTRLCHQQRQETQRLQAERQQLLAEAAALQGRCDTLSSQLAELTEAAERQRQRRDPGSWIRRGLRRLVRSLRPAVVPCGGGRDG